jgi:serine/threonine protein kinase
VTQDVRSGPGGPVPPGPPGQLFPGDQLAGYQIQEPIGRGGMAVVYRALDLRLGRLVALKVLAPNLSEDEAFRQRFIRESRAAAGVDHPHIIPVFEAGEAGGMLFIAMRYVSHGDVRTLIDAEGVLDLARVISITSQVASALDAAHAHGLVHRDVKPGNILLTPASSGDADHVYLSDFGLSKHSLTPSTLTSTGQFLGTLDYVSPEQIQGHPVDGRADQYALACTVVEMLSGKPPFQRDDTMALMWAQLEAEPPRLTSRRPDLPPAVDQVITTAMGKWPDSRYATCRDFAAALAAACLPEAAGLSPSAGYPAAEAEIPPAEQTWADPAPLPGASPSGVMPPPESAWPAPGLAVVPDPTWIESASHAWPPDGAGSVPAAELTAAPGWRDTPAAASGGRVPVQNFAGGYPASSAPGRGTPPAAPRGSAGDPNRRWSPPAGGAAQPRSHRTRNVLLGVLIALIGLAGVAGIAYKLKQHDTTAGSAPPVTVTKQPGTSASGAAADPARTVKAYFAAINHHRWLVAYRLSGDTEPFGKFRAGFAGTAHDTLTVQSVNGDQVTASLAARQTDGTVKYYSGTYTVTNGVISHTVVQQTS